MSQQESAGAAIIAAPGETHRAEPASPPQRPGAPKSPPQDQPPVLWREVLAVLLVVAVADLMLYRGYGYSGYAAFFAATAILLLWGKPERHVTPAGGLVIAMLLLLAAKMVWLGSPLQVFVAAVLLVATAVAAAGHAPYFGRLVAYAAQALAAPLPALPYYRRFIFGRRWTISRSAWASVSLPILAILVFGTLFILANPDVSRAVTRELRQFFDALEQNLVQYGPTWAEAFLWFAAAWLMIGLLRPAIVDSVLSRLGKEAATLVRDDDTEVESFLYAAYRNTLVAVIVLFAVYLIFEYKTLWFRVFPNGFHYSGYAHEGAAWLTVALAVATLVLSAIFRGLDAARPATAAAGPAGVDLVGGEPAAGGGSLQPAVHLCRLQRHDADAHGGPAGHHGGRRGLRSGDLENRARPQLSVVVPPASMDGGGRDVSLRPAARGFPRARLQRAANPGR